MRFREAAMISRQFFALLALLLACVPGRSAAAQLEDEPDEATAPAVPEAFPLCTNPPLESEPNGTPATATVLASPCWSSRGSVAPAMDVDYFRWNVVSGMRLWVLVDTGSPPMQANTRDSVLDLLATDGTTVLETDDDDGLGTGGNGDVESSLASAIAGHVPFETGNHYLRVRSFSASLIDHYRLVTMATFSSHEVPESEPNGTAGTATAATGSPTVRNGLISSAGESDFYRLTARTGEELFIVADGNPDRDITNTDVDLELRAGDGTTVLLNAASAASNDGMAAEAFRWVVTSSGTYYIRAFGHEGTATGFYNLLIAGNTELFLDGFEGGNTNAWSSDQP
jgi:hypothetical protein